MNCDTGEIRWMNDQERALLADKEKWFPITRAENTALMSKDQGLRPEILKKMRLRVPKK